MTAIGVSVAELGVLAGFDAPGFGPFSATTRRGPILLELVSVVSSQFLGNETTILITTAAGLG